MLGAVVPSEPSTPDHLMYTDSHCHLNFPELQSRLDQILDQMQAAQVTQALLISTRLETFSQVHQIALSQKHFWCTAGVHPDEEQVQEPTLEDLLTLGAMDKVVGIGETGLDYYRIGDRTWDDMQWQRDRFRCQIGRAHV